MTAIHKSYIMHPLEDEDELDCYDNIEGDYCAQFNTPFGDDLADVIEKLMYKRVEVDLSITMPDGTPLVSLTARPSRDNYLGDEDDAFQKLLWHHRPPVGSEEYRFVNVVVR